MVWRWCAGRGAFGVCFGVGGCWRGSYLGSFGLIVYMGGWVCQEGIKRRERWIWVNCEYMYYRNIVWLTKASLFPLVASHPHLHLCKSLFLSVTFREWLAAMFIRGDIALNRSVNTPISQIGNSPSAKPINTAHKSPHCPLHHQHSLPLLHLSQKKEKKTCSSS